MPPPSRSATGPARPGGTAASPVAGVSDPDWRHSTPRPDYHLYAQWMADVPAGAAGGRLYLDLPVGVHPDGFDPGGSPEAFAEGVAGGAPPGRFLLRPGRPGASGPLHPGAVRDERVPLPHRLPPPGHAPGSVVRIDHVMGLHRLYWVPEGFDAAARGLRPLPARGDGGHRGPRGPPVRDGGGGGGPGYGSRRGARAMADSRMLRSWVLEFAASADGSASRRRPSRPWPASATHDLPRFASFWDGDDIDELVGRGAQTEEWATSADRRRARPDLAQAERSEDRVPAAGRTGTGRPPCARACLDHLAPSAGPPGRGRPRGPLARATAPVNRPGLGPRGAATGGPGRARTRRRGAAPSASSWSTTLARMSDRHPARGRTERGPMSRRTQRGPEQPSDGTGEPGPRAVRRRTSTCSARGPTAAWPTAWAPTLVAPAGEGAAFAVWAPNAASVSVIGDWNGWDARSDRLSARAARASGKVPCAAARPGHVYKYAMTTPDGRRLEKADPVASAVRGATPDRVGAVGSLLHVGRRAVDGRAGGPPADWMRPCPSTRSTSGVGRRDPDGPVGCSATPRWRPCWSTHVRRAGLHPRRVPAR